MKLPAKGAKATKPVKLKGRAKKAPKQSFDFKSFQNQLNSLNKDNYGSAPLPIRLFLLAMIVVALSALAWFAAIKPKIDEIKAEEANQVGLLEQYKEKESKARHLDEYKAQVVDMEKEFNELLNQLPKETRVPELLDGISVVGTRSGVRFKELSADNKVEQEFFIEQPINIVALGNYHQFGDFLTGLTELSRIITLHDFEVTNQLSDNNRPNLSVIPELQMSLKTKTYQSREKVEEPVDATQADNKESTQ